MRYLLFTFVALTTFGTTGQAIAYCCWNPAICQAVCNAACCGASLKISRPSSPERLQSFSVEDLKRAQSEAMRESTSSDFVKLIGAELSSRDPGGALQIK
jgi:hypothetical protein